MMRRSLQILFWLFPLSLAAQGMLLNPSMSFGSSTLNNSLIAVWKLEETSSTRNDSKGSNHLTDNNTVASATGKLGTAADFEVANSEYLSIADNTDLSTGDIDFTFALWVQLESKTANMFFATKQAGAGVREYNTQYNSAVDRFRFGVSNDGTATVNVDASALGSPSTATWYFIVVWHDATANTINIQVNDGTVNSASHTTGVFNSTAAFTLGATGTPASYHDGLIDNVYFWKRVLTTDERTALYNSGNGKDYPF